MSIDALKQLIGDCISMMEYHIEQTRPIHTTTVAIQAAKEALKAIAEAEKQEPVGYVSWGYEAVWNGKPPKAESNLYTHPYVPTERQPKRYVATPREPLTDEQFQAIRKRLFRKDGWDGDGWDLALKEAIEAAHGIKEKNNG